MGLIHKILCGDKELDCDVCDVVECLVALETS